MCGIVGYVGPRDSVPILMDGLQRLEYRGYDSAGLAVARAGKLELRKCVGRLQALANLLEKKPLAGGPGIGHTRWATHGEPSEVNSHPHTDSTGRLAVVHNGIIENFEALREALERKGHHFRSQTDTEVIPHLIEKELKEGAKNLLTALRLALTKARGAYALGIYSLDEPDTLFAARLGSPLIIGVGEGENFIASDAPAILNRTRRVIYLEDGEIAVLKAGGIKVFKLDGAVVTPKVVEVRLQAEAAERAGFETFMRKEIHEQPRVLRSLLARHVTARDAVALQEVGFSDNDWRGFQRMIVVSCGTAYYAGLYGRLIFGALTGLPVEVELGSEFRYRDTNLEANTLVVSVSQSGETADTLASIRMARRAGCRALAICNTPGSSLVRESDAAFYTEAGPEIGVASTKAYTAQLMAFALIATHLGRVRGELTAEQEAEFVRALRAVPDAIHHVLSTETAIRAVAAKHCDGPSALYLGRKFNYPTALEGALKNKEISYQHAEGYAAGEMKHGPIALINEYLPVICLCTRTRDEVYEKMISNMKEVEARRGRIIAVANPGDETVRKLAEDILEVPLVSDELSPLVNVVVLQLLAYFAAQARGNDIDKPRNLAKSVTVE